jgi:two-component system chemotaxis response regulator CheB
MEKHAQTVEKVVVIGASAGGIDALKQSLSGLPADLPAAILMVQHLRPDRWTRLPEYLNHHTPLRMCLARDGMLLEAGAGYIAVPGQHLRVGNGRLVLSLEAPVHYVRPSADVLFASAARAFGPNVIGVVLSGTGCDGARGCLEIKAKGGVTIAQDERTSRYFGMPKASIDAGGIDYVLPLNEIAGKIVSLTRQKRRGGNKGG